MQATVKARVSAAAFLSGDAEAGNRGLAVEMLHFEYVAIERPVVPPGRKPGVRIRGE